MGAGQGAPAGGDAELHAAADVVAFERLGELARDLVGAAGEQTEFGVGLDGGADAGDELAAVAQHRAARGPDAEGVGVGVGGADDLRTRDLEPTLSAALDGAAVSRVRLDVDRGRLVAGTVELFVRYGAVIPEVAARAQALAVAAVDDLLGGPDPARRWDVHVSDVTVGDPHHVDPVDELVVPRTP